MKITTQHTKKLISVFIVLILASSLMLVKGCGGSGSGECGEDTAPYGSTILKSEDGTFEVTAASGATTDTGECVQNILFTVLDPLGVPLSDITVEVLGSHYIALHQPGVSCTTSLGAYGWPGAGISALVTKTSAGGVVAVDVGSGLISQPTSTYTSTSVDVSVQVTSCSAQALQTNSITVNWTP